MNIIQGGGESSYWGSRQSWVDCEKVQCVAGYVSFGYYVLGKYKVMPTFSFSLLDSRGIELPHRTATSVRNKAAPKERSRRTDIVVFSMHCLCGRRSLPLEVPGSQRNRMDPYYADSAKSVLAWREVSVPLPQAGNFLATWETQLVVSLCSSINRANQEATFAPN